MNTFPVIATSSRFESYIIIIPVFQSNATARSTPYTAWRIFRYVHTFRPKVHNKLYALFERGDSKKGRKMNNYRKQNSPRALESTSCGKYAFRALYITVRAYNIGVYTVQRFKDISLKKKIKLSRFFIVIIINVKVKIIEAKIYVHSSDILVIADKSFFFFFFTPRWFITGNQTPSWTIARVVASVICVRTIFLANTVRVHTL